ncbi:MAG TPA: DUF3300 domain-containing protein [Stellaceae bacterium]|nr:DUF3300 domain-containing protein [Stellaceae bacterium]
MKHLYESVFSGALLALLVAAPLTSQAQTTPQGPTPAEAQAALNPAPSQFTNAQLDQMLAPIALYPDQLLTQVLMASTFPDQLVDAQKWLQDPHNAALKGDDLANALTPLPWDPSVKSLAAFPQIIAMMVNHLDWTQALGTAFANQEVQVFARTQFLRDRAKQAGFLKSNSQIAVSEQDSDIVIAPANPTEVFVPVYNPADVYGPWPDSDYPPVFLPPPPGFYSGAIGAGIGFSVGFGVIAPLWGWGHPDWRNHSVTIDPGRYEHITSQTYIQQNHIDIQGGAWHRSGPVAFVPEAQRPRPTYQSNEAPRGTVQPSQAFRSNAAGPHPAGEAQPGPHPAGIPPHPEEHAAPAGPHPAGTPPHPEAAPAHPEERAAPAGTPPHPEAAPAHPEEHTAPAGPHPAGAPPHPEAAPAHPEEHAAPPPPAPHPAPPAPHPEAAPPHPAPPAAHPAPPPHPAAPPPKAPPKPGEDHPDEPQH